MNVNMHGIITADYY